MPTERRIPPPEELTPSELAFVFRSQRATIQSEDEPREADADVKEWNPEGIAEDTMTALIVVVAILANEKAGAITIRETENGIVLTPTGRVIPWPRGTIESRIIGESAATVKVMVHDWLRADSLNPFGRALTMVRIGATVHGYVATPDPETYYASLSPAPVAALIESCPFYTRLLNEVAAGISSRKHAFTVTHYERFGEASIPRDNFQEPSPWELEALIDQKAATPELEKGSRVGLTGCFVVVGLLVIAIVCGVGYVAFDIIKELHLWKYCAPILLAAIGFVVFNLLRLNAARRIEKRIIEIDHAQQTSTPEQPVTIAPSEGVSAPPLTIIDPHALPEVSTDVSFPLPPRLLMLRVFGSPAIQNLLELTKPWEEFGVITHLAGPGTAGEHVKDVLNVTIGRVDHVITENDQELEEAFARIGARKKGRDSIQCTGATWKKAIDRLLADASAVLMDLSSLSREHQGCAYELGLLLDRLPLGRVTLLVNDDSDLDCLREILDRAWLQIDERSPNRNASGLTWTAIRIGGLADQRPDENAYEFERRSRHRLQPSQLIGFLKNAARSPSV